jgi:menaquinone-dependent protoporphyrinogen oxidase
MKAAVFFATREGHTRKIAERVAAAIRAHGVETDVVDTRTLRSPVDWSHYAIACVAASVHLGHHEREMVAFARRHRERLTHVRAVFLSVTLSEAGAEDPKAPPDRREQAAADARRMIDVFIAETGWRPARTLPVAGALTYTRYNFLVRFVMKRIARKQGASTDTSRDHEFTNWPAVDAMVEQLFRPAAAPAG